MKSYPHAAGGVPLQWRDHFCDQRRRATGVARPQRRCALFVLAVLAFCIPRIAIAQTDNVVVRATIKPESGAVLGQHVRVLVDVLFPGEMPRPPRVSLSDMPGAQIVRYETQATTMNDTIDGKSYLGQRFEFALYARRGGTLTIPAPAVTVLDAAGDETGRVRGQPLDVEITVPAGVDPSRPVVAAESFTLEQQWSPAPTGSFKAGDALVRTITRTAADVPGMAMLDLPFTAPPGVRVYLDPPLSDDSIDRGDVTGRRTDRATYVFEAGGSFVIPDVGQPWWDLSSDRLRQAEGRGVTVAVVAAVKPITARDRIERWLFGVATALGVLALVWWAWPRVRALHAEHRARWLASERKAFEDLQAACRRGDAKAVYRAFVAWRQRFSRPAALSTLAEEIESVLFAGAPWSHETARAFAQQSSAVRREIGQVGPLLSALPPLNPPRPASS
jgi:hypothetical protein